MLFPVISVILFLLGFENGGLQLALLRVANEFALSGAMMGSLFAAQNAAVIVTPVILTILGDRVGKKRMVLIAAAMFAAGCALVSSSRSAVQLIGCIFLTGAGYSGVETLGTAMLADAYPARSGRYINLTQCFFSLGAVAGPLICTKLMERTGYGWRIIFVIPAVCAALWLLMMLMTQVPAVQSLPADADGVTEGNGKGLRGAGFSLLFFVLPACILLYVGLEGTAGGFVDSFLYRELLSPSLGAYAISAYWLCMMLTRLLFGVLRVSEGKTVGVCTFGCAAALFALSRCRTPAVAFAVICVLGAASGPIWPFLIDLAAKWRPEHSGTAVSVMMTAGGIGGVTVPVLFGAWVDERGLRAAFMLLAMLLLLSGALFLLYTKGRKREDAHA